MADSSKETAKLLADEDDLVLVHRRLLEGVRFFDRYASNMGQYNTLHTTEEGRRSEIIGRWSAFNFCWLNKRCLLHFILMFTNSFAELFKACDPWQVPACAAPAFDCFRTAAGHIHGQFIWGVRGLEAAANLAEAAGLNADSNHWKSEAARFQADLLHSIKKVIADKQLAYIPGSVEWADFDPTATANAIALLDFADALPQEPLRAMLETYLEEFRRKHRWEMQ